MPHVGAGGYCFRTKEILRNLKNTKLDFSNNTGEKIKIGARVAQDYLKLILDDVINNGTRFRFSTPSEVYICIEPIMQDEFSKSRQMGKFYDVDPLESNFTGHDLCIIRKAGVHRIKRSIAVNYELKDIITEKTNNGYKY